MMLKELKFISDRDYGITLYRDKRNSVMNVSITLESTEER